MKQRIGIGYDIHHMIEGRPLILGGVMIPHDRGLLGHSDGDALLHAIADAMLGAAALGDIGRHFPDTDSRWKGADSAELLARVATLVRKEGFALINIDSNIVAQNPKLAPHIDRMRERIAEILGMERERINIKARTNEGLDSVGRGEAIATQAIVLLLHI